MMNSSYRKALREQRAPLRLLLVKTLRFLCVLLLILFVVSASGYQQAWIAKYTSGPGSTNPPVGMGLDKDGNIYVAVSSTRPTPPYDLDYLVVKYSHTGNPLWANRFGAPGVDEKVRAMVVNTNGEVFVTGTANTIKYHPSGLLAWTAPYAGRDITADSNGNSYVTGFLTNDFSTVKLNAQGSNTWLRTWDYTGREDASEIIAVDNVGNVFVAGFGAFLCDRAGCYIAAHK